MKNNKKLMLSCAWSQPWVEVLLALNQKTCVDIETAIVWRSDRLRFEESFPNAKLLNVEDLWLFDSIGEIEPRGYVIDQKHLIVAETMLRRQNSLFYKHNYSESTYLFMKYVDFWMSKISNIDLIISPSVPHRFFDYALYVAAELNSKPYLTFQQLPFGSRILPLRQIYEMPKASPLICNDRLPSDVETSIGKILKTYSDAIPDYMQNQAKNAAWSRKIKNFLRKFSFKSIPYRIKGDRKPNSYQIMSTPLVGKMRKTWLKFLLIRIHNAYKIYRLRSAYASKASNVDLNNKFIFFALNYQPEETSCPSAFEYADQLLAIRLLRSKISKNVAIYVKEHKTQLYYEYEGDRGRNEAFYDYIKDLGPNIHLVDQNFDPFKLIESSLAVATLTGTVGWEGIVKEKPVIIFGRAWYETHPNVLKLTEQTKISDIEQHLKSDSQKLSETKIWLNSVLNSSIRAIHYKGWIDRRDVSMKESAANLSDYIYSKFLK